MKTSNMLRNKIIINSRQVNSKRKINVSDKVSFRRSVDACKCMGLNYQGFQRAGARHPFEANTLIWFPKLYPNGTWDNSYDDSTGIIRASSDR